MTDPSARAPLPFTAPNLLAPMEGVTEPCFRDLVLGLHRPADLGGAFTEFVRVVDAALPRRVLREKLGTHRHPQPVGLQLMGSDVAAVAETARRAAEAGASLVDLNFGCPSKGALRGCAGSALLDDPAAIRNLVRACVEAVPASVFVTAKIRAGGANDSKLEALAHAVEDGGAALLTVHCRTRDEGYADTADWNRLRRARAAVRLPLCGNGGIVRFDDLARLRRETGCDFTMVGRAALADPWIFSGRPVGAVEAARFLEAYGTALMTSGKAHLAGAVMRIKQLLAHWTAGALVDADRQLWLRERDPHALWARLLTLTGAAACGPAA